MAFGAAISAQILTSVLNGAVVSLHLDDPGDTGAAEADGGSYARQPCVWSVDAAQGFARNLEPLVFRGLPAGTYRGWGVRTAAGDWFDGGLFDSPITVPDGGTIEIAAGALRISGPEYGADPSELLYQIPADRDGFWLPGLMAVGGIPADDDPVRPASVWLPGGDPYGGYSIDPALGDGVQDATAAIDAAIFAAGQEASETSRRIVLLPPGTFRISGEGLVVTRNVVLRGQGWRGSNATKLVRPTEDPDAFPVAIIGNRWPATELAAMVVEDAQHGSRSVTLDRVPDVAPGDLVQIDQLDDETRVGSKYNPVNQPPGSPSRGWFSGMSRPTGQTLEVESVDGNVVTFSTPLRLTYYADLQPRLLTFSAPTHAWAGIEDLYVEGGRGGDGGGGIHVFASKYCWVKNVEVRRTQGTAVALDSCFRCELRDSFIHTPFDPAGPSPGGGAYGIGLVLYASDNLIENCISWNINKVVICRASGGGNVFGYNYMEDGWGAGYPTIPEVGLNAAHYATPHHELFEGNQSWNISGDFFWGNSIYLTFFRNHVTGLRRGLASPLIQDLIQRRFIDVPEAQFWTTCVGNVIGNPATDYSSGLFVYETLAPPWFESWSMWLIGKGGDDSVDERVQETCIRHANHDHLTKEQRFEDARHEIPDSLYLSSKPAFFGSNPWPWVDPTTGEIHTLPARALFDQLVAEGYIGE